VGKLAYIKTVHATKDKGYPITCLCKHRRLQPICNLSARRDGRSPCPGIFTTRKYPVPNVQESGWALRTHVIEVHKKYLYTPLTDMETV